MAIWTVSTYYKKSCEEREIWTHSDHGTMIRTNGFRRASYTVETSNDSPPEFEFDFVPGGDGKKDSIDMNNCEFNNIESAELVELFDGGCWGGTEWPDDMDEEEIQRLEELMEEEGYYALEEEGWMLDETEVWVWGPILIEDEEGNQVRIICADEDGNVIDFVEGE
jgi:hypothetical protein